MDKGETKEAEKLFTEALEQGVKQPAEAAYMLGVLAGQKIEYEKAFQYYNRAMELEKDNPEYLSQSGLMAMTLGKYGEAEPFLLKALEIREKVLPPEHTDIALNLTSLAKLYCDLGRYAEAEPLYERGIAIIEKILPDNPFIVLMMINHALCLSKLNRIPEAEEVDARAKGIVERHGEKNNPQ